MSKTVLITGASRGIGAATVKLLSQINSNVGKIILVARDSDEFDILVGKCRMEFEHIEYIVLKKNLASTSETRDITKAIIDKGLNIDILINNAGHTNPKSIPEIDLDDFRTTMEVNLISPFLLVQSLLHAGNSFKTIINIASTAGINGRAGWLTYSTSKAAMICMSDVMRQELKVYGVRVVCLSPGRCATDLRKRLAPDENPITIMQPESVAKIINLMLSENGRFIDSHNVVVRE